MLMLKIRMNKRFVISTLIILVVVVSLAFVARKTRQGAGDSPLPAAGESTPAMTPLGPIPYYLQNDPQWGAETIGGSDESMAAAGCTVTCLSMGLAALGYDMTPAQVCAGLKRYGGFTSNGYVIWAGVKALTGGAVQVRVAQLRHEIIEEELTAKRPVIAKIMLTETIAHWILIVGKEDGDYLAMDPLNQERALVRLPSDDIRAIRVFEKR